MRRRVSKRAEMKKGIRRLTFIVGKIFMVYSKEKSGDAHFAILEAVMASVR